MTEQFPPQGPNGPMPPNYPQGSPPYPGSPQSNPQYNPGPGPARGDGVQKRPFYKKAWFMITAAGVVGIVLGSATAGGGTAESASPAVVQTATATVTETVEVEGEQLPPEPGETVTMTATATVETTVLETVTAEPPGPAAAFGDGMFEVGTDIQPGTYGTNEEGCYWARLAGADGELDSINANGNGASIVEIKSSDKFFESRRCGDWVQR